MSQVIQQDAIQKQVDQRISFERQNNVGYLTLNRAKKLNVIDNELLKVIYPQFKECEDSKDIKFLVIQNTGKAFCVGADVGDISKNMFDRGPKGFKAYQDQLDLHYEVMHYIGTMKTPMVSIMDGIVIGGGLTVSAFMHFRIATENTKFLMPETKIGSYTDSGGSYILPRMEGNLGVYLGLTRNSFQAEDVLFSGLATHFMNSSDVPALNAALSKLEHPTLEAINEVINRFTAKDDHIPQSYTLNTAFREKINKCFQHNTVEEIFQALERDGSSFALKARKAMLQGSPTSLKISLEAIRRGAHLSLQGCFSMEYDLWNIVPFQHDFREGVSAFFAKRTPQWQPSKLEDVDLESYIRGNLFGFQHETRRAYFTSDEDYIAYPFFRFGLPSVEEIQAVQKKYNLKSMSEVESWFLIEHQGKFGVRQRVQQVLEEDQYQKSLARVLLHCEAKL